MSLANFTLLHVVISLIGIVAGAVFAFYLNAFVAVAQGLVLVIFIALFVGAVIRFRPSPA